MKRVLSWLLLFVLCTALIASICSAYNGDTIVYVTRTGECYHRKRCLYSVNKIEMTLEEAVNSGYRACSHCKPPALDLTGEASATPEPTPTPADTQDDSSSSSASGALVALSTIACAAVYFTHRVRRKR